MGKKKIIVVDDEPDILDIISTNLKNAGYETAAASGGAPALKLIEKEKPDLVLLDLMMPEPDGLEVCKILKANEKTAHIPIIMVTAREEEVDRLLGFELGADDYITKPFSVRELVLRVRAVLRRGGRVEGKDSKSLFLQVGDVRMDKASHTVWVGDKKKEFTLLEFRLLDEFMSHPGRVFSRDQLLDKVWGYNAEIFSRTVDTHIQRLRTKLGKAGDMIETVRGVGYRLKEGQEYVS
ncbi:MAG: response regulator [Nitrospinae bacterium]|nr:response regulator [Nitrospinota bacterium]